MTANEKQITDRIMNAVRRERDRQKYGGYGAKDKEHINGELIDAATSYAELAKKQVLTRDWSKVEELKKHKYNSGFVPTGGLDEGYLNANHSVALPQSWPFGANMWAPHSPKRNLVRAAALIIAELERMEKADREYIAVPKKRPRRLERFEWDTAVEGPIPVYTTAVEGPIPVYTTAVDLASAAASMSNPVTYFTTNTGNINAISYGSAQAGTQF